MLTLSELDFLTNFALSAFSNLIGFFIFIFVDLIKNGNDRLLLIDNRQRVPPHSEKDTINHTRRVVVVERFHFIFKRRHVLRVVTLQRKREAIIGVKRLRAGALLELEG